MPVFTCVDLIKKAQTWAKLCTYACSMLLNAVLVTLKESLCAQFIFELQSNLQIFCIIIYKITIIILKLIDVSSVLEFYLYSKINPKNILT